MVSGLANSANHQFFSTGQYVLKKLAPRVFHWQQDYRDISWQPTPAYKKRLQ